MATEFLPDCLLDWTIPDASLPPRFPAASPLPPEVERWIEVNTQTLPHPWPAQQEPGAAPMQPQASESGHDLDLTGSSEDTAILLIEACPDYGENNQPMADDENEAVLSAHAPEDAALPSIETLSVYLDSSPTVISGDNEVVLQQAILPPPEYLQPEDKESLPAIPEAPDCQTGWHAAGKSALSPRLPVLSPLPPESDKWKAGRGRQWASIIFITLTVFLIFSGGYLVFLGHLAGPNSSQTTSQPVSKNDTGDGLATVPTEAANTNPYISGGTLVFSDLLNAASSNWDQNAGCAFKDGRYRVTATTFESCALNPNVSLANFVLEVKVTLLQGDVGGFFFRENKRTQKSNAYLLDFDSKGGYQLWNYSASGAAKLIDHGVSSNFHAGYNQTNTIALIAQGANITLYMNGHKVKHFTDHTYSKGGFSLISSEYARHTGIAKAAYHDLRLWRL